MVKERSSANYRRWKGGTDEWVDVWMDQLYVDIKRERGRETEIYKKIIEMKFEKRDIHIKMRGKRNDGLTG